MSNKITFYVNFPFWTAYKANLSLLMYIPLRLLFSLIFPVAAFYLCFLWFRAHHVPAFHEVIMLLFMLFFTPIIAGINLYFARKNNKLAEGPFLYTFNSEGVECSSEAFNFSLKWSGILKVKVSKEFIYLFVSPGSAHCIPLVDSNKANATKELLELISEHTKT